MPAEQSALAMFLIHKHFDPASRQRRPTWVGSCGCTQRRPTWVGSRGCTQRRPTWIDSFKMPGRRLAQKAVDATSALSYFGCVANQAKNAGGAGGEPMAFEAALKRLEGLVEAMESGDLPLETLLEKYEEGSRLVKVCQAKLEEAELKIQKLEKTASGEFVLKPAEPGPIQGKNE